MLRRFFIQFVSAVWAMMLSLTAAAQTNPSHNEKEQKSAKEQSGTLRIETELVQIDLVVADKQGKLVGNLKREDFELYEDGKKQQVTHFAVGTSKQPAKWLPNERKQPAGNASRASERLDTAVETTTGRHIVLAVDDFHLEAGNLMWTRKSLLRFLNEQMVAGDRVALVTTSGSLGLFQQFTNERAVLERAINRLTLQNREVTSKHDRPRITDYQAELIDFGDRDALELAVREIELLEGQPQQQQNSGGRGGRSGGSSGGSSGGGGSSGNSGGFSPREQYEQRARSLARMIVLQNAHYTRTTLVTLESLIRTLRGLPGRKMLVLLSDGFYMGGSIASQVFDIRRITDAATRAGVVIYALDARGLVVDIPGGDASEPSRPFAAQIPGVQERMQSASIQAKLDGLNALAADTGGFLFKNSNDLNLGLQRVLDDNEIYYVIAYQPTTTYRDGRYRRLEVRIANHSEWKVRTRKGYFSPNEKAEREAAKAEEKQQKVAPKPGEKLLLENDAELRTGLASLFPLREMPVEMAADFMDLADAGPSAMIVVQIEGRGLELLETNGTHQAAIDLAGLIFDERGKSVGGFTERIMLNLKPENFERLLKQGLEYRRLAALKPGFYQIRLAVKDERTKRLGSTTGWVEIPDLSKKTLGLSGVFLSPGESELDAAQSGNGGGYQPRPSSASRRFKRESNLDFMIFAYNAKADKTPPDLVVQAQVFSGSKLIHASAPAKMIVPSDADWQRVPYAARILTKEFEPGEYELKLLVIDRQTKASTSRRVNFVLE